MTLVHVGGLLWEAPGAVRGVELRERAPRLGPDVELAGPLIGSLRLQRTNRGILVQAVAEAPVRRTCGRCLQAFVEPARIEATEEFLPSVDPLTGVPLPGPDPVEEASRINAHHEIDLGPLLHDEFVLGEPMTPLCRPDCPGLCPGCGRRLDVGSCSCEVEELDPRLAVLGAWREDHTAPD